MRLIGIVTLMNKPFGKLLAQWRKHRRYSQLQLAVELDISSKHISFLETGRSIPSRDMLLKIASFLILPKREINQWLYAAGYAPIYQELSEGDESLKLVYSAIDQMLTNHMPYPAIVMNQNWDLVQANDSAKKLMHDLGFSNHQNILEALIKDSPDTSKIINWHETASVVLTRLRHEMSLLGGSERLNELESRLAKCFSPKQEKITSDTNQAALCMNLNMGENRLSFFSIIAQLGAIQDVAVSEFKVELMFPSDEETKAYYQKK